MKLPLNFFENLTQDQFNYVIDTLYLYKQLNPKHDVYINEKTFKTAITVVSQFMTNMNKKKSF
jgi:hypothetical protein